MIRTVVSRDDHLYECFPDIARCGDGTLVCIYRESMEHGPFPFSRIACRRSLDGGRTWSPRKVIDECVADEEEVEGASALLTEDAWTGYRESRQRISDDAKIGTSINCARVICLKDGQLVMVADYYHQRWTNLIFRSFDNGQTWSGPEDPGLPKGLVPALTELSNGRLLLALTRHAHRDTFAETGKNLESPENNEIQLASDPRLIETQMVCFSDDQGRSWGQPVDIPCKTSQNLSEGSFVELDSGTIVGFLRDDSLKDRRGYKVLSHDGGDTWIGPLPTQMLGLSGRPKAGLLRSGEVCITYRLRLPNMMLGLHLMTQESAAYEGDVDYYNADKPWHMRFGLHGRTVVLDMDRRIYQDGGYSGWVQLESGDILVVDYIVDDAPLAHIRGYLVNRNDIVLFPDGALPTIAPVNKPTPFESTAADLAERQYRRLISTGGHD